MGKYFITFNKIKQIMGKYFVIFQVNQIQIPTNIKVTFCFIQ